jgi:osmoprotectant transport system permease protein
MVQNIPYVIDKFVQHIYLFVISWAAAVLVGLGIAIFSTRPGRRKLGQTILSITGAAQSVPSIAVIAIVFIFMGIGAAPALFALFLYSLVPITFNAASGLLSVEPSMKRAARGMGMTNGQILRRIELPVSVSAIASGARSAATINIGTATIASAIGAGGLGEIIFIGLRVTDQSMIFAGAFPAAVLAVIVDTILSGVERGLTSQGLKIGASDVT